MPAGKYSDDFSDAKVGDEVFYRTGYSEKNVRICKIEKLHKLHVVADGMKWRRDGGRAAGEWSYHGSGALQYLTPERRANIEAEVAEQRASRLCREAGNALLAAAKSSEQIAIVQKLIPNLAEVVKALTAKEEK